MPIAHIHQGESANNPLLRLPLGETQELTRYSLLIILLSQFIW